MVRVLSVGVTGAPEAHASGFARELLAQGFSRLSAANQLRVFAHMSRWLSQQRLRPRDLTEKRALEFLGTRRRSEARRPHAGHGEVWKSSRLYQSR